MHQPGSQAVLADNAATTAWLSEWRGTHLPPQYLPHTAAATTTGKSSFAVILIHCHTGGQRTWNHCKELRAKAPHPQLPEASEATTGPVKRWKECCPIPPLKKQRPPSDIEPALEVKADLMRLSLCHLHGID